LNMSGSTAAATTASVAARVRAVEADAGGRFRDGLALVVPLLLAIEFVGPGRLYLSEVVLAAMLPALLFSHRQAGLAPLPAAFVVLCLVWLDGLVATDIFRSTPIHDLERGWSKVVFTVSNFVALYLIFENRPRRLVLFGYGLATGLALTYVVDPGPYASSDAWKFGYGYSFTLVGVLFSCTDAVTRRRALRCGVLAATALANLLHDFRSLAGVCVLTTVYVAAAGIRGRDGARWPIRVSPMRFLGVATLLAAVAFSFVSLYSHLALSGALGASASKKYAAQAGGTVGLLTRGRPEILVSSRAVADSPLLGHGSWAKDPKYLEMQIGAGQHPSPATLAQGLIPTHSYLMGAWVEAGVLGAFVWAWALWLALLVLTKLHRRDGRLVPLIAFAGFALTWNVLFSPYGSFERLIAPFYVLILIFASRSLGTERDSEVPH
jgi:hypothetical protein